MDITQLNNKLEQFCSSISQIRTALNTKLGGGYSSNNLADVAPAIESMSTTRSMGSRSVTFKQNAIIFGVRVKQSEKDPAKRITPLKDLVGTVPITYDSATETVDYGTMKDSFLFKAMNHVVMRKRDGSEEIELDPNDYTKKLDGSEAPSNHYPCDYDTFAKVSKLYTYQYTSNGYEYYYISDQKVDSNYNAIGFKRENGSEAPYFYLGTYGANTRTIDNLKILTSESSTNISSGKKSFNDVSAWARNAGEGYSLQQFQMTNFYQNAFLMLCQNHSCQQLGAGRNMLKNNTNVTNYQTGRLDQKGPVCLGDSIKFMHVEDLWAAAGEVYLDGLAYKGNTIRVRMYPPYITKIDTSDSSIANFVDSKYTTFNDTVLLSYSDGAEMNIKGYESSNKQGRIPSLLEGYYPSSYAAAAYNLKQYSTTYVFPMATGSYSIFSFRCPITTNGDFGGTQAERSSYARLALIV